MKVFCDMNHVKGIYIYMYDVPIYAKCEITSFTKLLYLESHNQVYFCLLEQFASNDEVSQMSHKLKS